MTCQFLGLSCLLAAGLSAQVVTGTVRDDSSSRPLSGAQIAIEGTDARATSDSMGRFSVEAKAGTRIVIFRMLGYREQRVRVEAKRGETVQADADLVRLPTQALAQVEVKADPIPHSLREAFIERRKLALGKFMDSTVLRRNDARQTAEALREMGLRIVSWNDPDCRPKGSCTPELRAVNPTREVMDALGFPSWCYSTVVYDNTVIYRSGGKGGRPPNFRVDFPVQSLDAIEYYYSASITPIEFQGYGTECGVVVLWSRRGHQ